MNIKVTKKYNPVTDEYFATITIDDENIAAAVIPNSVIEIKTQSLDEYTKIETEIVQKIKAKYDAYKKKMAKFSDKFSGEKLIPLD